MLTSVQICFSVVERGKQSLAEKYIAYLGVAVA
jgi:hypothetical protein